MADNLGFVDEQPLIDFESALGFVSWRADYDAALEAFMDNGGDPEQFPRPNLFGDIIAGTLRNKHGAVMIGGVISLVDDQGRPWSFCSCEKYLAYLANPGSFENIDEDDECVRGPVKTEYQGGGQTTCHNHWKSCWWVEIGNNRKVNQNLAFYYGPPSPEGWTVATSEMRAFKKKNGKWKLRRLWMKVNVSGTISNTECRRTEPFTRSKGYRWNRRIERHQGWIGNYTFVDGDVKGYYWYTTSGASNGQVLEHTYSGCD